MSIRREHSIQNVFVLALFAVFAAATLFTLMFGARVYRSMEQKDTDAYNTGIAGAYIAQRLRHSGETVGVSIGTFGDGDALYIFEQTGGVDYRTVIYVCGGYLCELYTEKGLDLPPDAGTQLLECAGAEFEELDTGLISMEISGTDGQKSRLVIALREGRCLAV